ncbi:MAG TPA: patatin-like phospholipase family protein [Oscillospiraceae bacterium]|nr:patatin-like phospholipase family protein [Oscillospiraceae bacterium]
MFKRGKKVGLALGGGSARGFAHIGVIKVLKLAGVPIDLITGTSMGSVVGAAYCAGLELPLLERLFSHADSKLWLDWTFPHMGLAAGDKLEQLMLLLTRRKTFDQLEVPLAIVATDLCRGEKVVMQEGLVARAVRASAAIPGIFRPLEEGEQVLVDGAVIERVPAPTARTLGADLVIAVDVGIYLDGHKPQHILDVITQSLDVMQRDLSRYSLEAADVVISPALREIAPGHFHRAKEAIKAGEEAAHEALPSIRQMLEKEGLWKLNETIT